MELIGTVVAELRRPQGAGRNDERMEIIPQSLFCFAKAGYKMHRII